MTFHAPKVIPGLDMEPNRVLVASLNDVQTDLAALSEPLDNVTPVKTSAYVAKLGDLVRAIPPAAGLSVLLPLSTVANAGEHIRIALESVASGGSVLVTVSGGQLINGQTTLTLGAVGLTDMVSLGPQDGWSAVPFFGAPTWSNVLGFGASSGPHNPLIQNGQFIGFGDPASAAGLDGDIRGGVLATTGVLKFRSNDDFNIQADHVLTLQGNTGDVDINSGVLVHANGTTGVQLDTNAVQRLLIDATGAWNIGGTPGTAGQLLTSHAAGTPPTWATFAPGAGTIPLTALATEAANTFVANATAGVASPTAVASNAQGVMGRTSGNIQSIDSAVQTALIRGSGSVFWGAAANNQVLCRNGAGDLGFQTLVDTNFTVNTISNASLAQGAANTIKGNWTAALANEADNAVGANTVVGRVAGNIVAAQLVGAQVAAATLPLTTLATQAALSVDANATNAVASPTALASSAAFQHLRVNSANTALEWSRNTLGEIPAGTVGSAASIQPTATSVSAATTVLALVTAFSIPANTLVVGSSWEIMAQGSFTRGATLTALNLVFTLLLGAASLATGAVASFIVTGKGHFMVVCRFTVLTTGAGGTAMAVITVTGDCGTVVASGFSFVAGADNVAIALNTTIANNFGVTGNMSLGVAATVLQALGGRVSPCS